MLRTKLIDIGSAIFTAIRIVLFFTFWGILIAALSSLIIKAIHS